MIIRRFDTGVPGIELWQIRWDTFHPIDQATLKEQFDARQVPVVLDLRALSLSIDDVQILVTASAAFRQKGKLALVVADQATLENLTRWGFNDEAALGRVFLDPVPAIKILHDAGDRQRVVQTHPKRARLVSGR